MKYFYFIMLSVMGMRPSSLTGADKMVTTRPYLLNDNFNKILASGHVNFELTYDNNQESVAVKTEQWVHQSYINPSIKPNNCLHIEMQDGIDYPPITVYVNYRTPLVSLETTGASSMTSTNVIYSDRSLPLNLAHSGASKATLELNHGNNLITDISGSSQVRLSGSIQGDGQLTVAGAAQVNAIACEMQAVNLEVSGSGQAYVKAVKMIDASATGASKIYYQGYLRNQKTSGAGSIKQYLPLQSL